MKRKTIFACVLLGGLLGWQSLAAQNRQEVPSLQWGITAGLNGLNAGTLNLSDGRGRWGGHIGATVSLPLSVRNSHWFLDAAAKLLLLREHSHTLYGEMDWASGSDEVTLTRYGVKRDAYCLNIPVHIGYKWAVSRQVSLFGSAGPYVAVGLFGKTKGFSQTEGEKAVEASENTFPSQIGHRTEWGIGAKLGVELYRHYQIGIAYDYGIGKIRYNGNGDNHNANFSFLVGYSF